MARTGRNIAMLLCIAGCMLPWTTSVTPEEDSRAPMPDFLFRYLRQQRQKPRSLDMFMYNNNYQPKFSNHRTWTRFTKRRTTKKFCAFQNEQCIPGTQHCCEGMVCRNKFNHICLYPLESCFCTIGDQK